MEEHFNQGRKAFAEGNTHNPHHAIDTVTGERTKAMTRRIEWFLGYHSARLEKENEGKGFIVAQSIDGESLVLLTQEQQAFLAYLGVAIESLTLARGMGPSLMAQTGADEAIGQVLKLGAIVEAVAFRTQGGWSSRSVITGEVQ